MRAVTVAVNGRMTKLTLHVETDGQIRSIDLKHTSPCRVLQATALNVSSAHSGLSDGVAVSPALTCKVEPSGHIMRRMDVHRQRHRGQPRSIVWGHCSKRNLKWGHFDRSELH